MKQSKSPLRVRVDTELFDHLRHFRNMGWSKPGAEELRAYAFKRIQDNPTITVLRQKNGASYPTSSKIEINEGVVSLVHRAVDNVMSGHFYKRLVG